MKWIQKVLIFIFLEIQMKIKNSISQAFNKKKIFNMNIHIKIYQKNQKN